MATPGDVGGDIAWVQEQEGIGDLGHHVPHFYA
jgi:hypothetical protein